MPRAGPGRSKRTARRRRRTTTGSTAIDGCRPRRRAVQFRAAFAATVQTILQELVYDAASEGAVWPFDRGYIRPPHFHGQIELLLIRRGSALVHLGARSEPVRGGQLCWIPPGVPHVMSAFSKDFDMWVIQLEPSLLGACWRALSGAEEDEASDPFGWMILFGDQLSGHPVVDVDGRDL